MEKKLYWLVKSNGDLSQTVQNLIQAQEMIEGDFECQSEGGLYSIEDLQYTISPVMLTEKEIENLVD